MGGKKKKGGIFGNSVVGKIAAASLAPMTAPTALVDKATGGKLGLSKAAGLDDLVGDISKGIGIKGSTPGAGGTYNPEMAAFTPNQQRQAFAEQLRLQSLGQGPSIAQQQLQTGTNRNISQLAGAVAASRSSNPALAQRGAMQQQADATQQAAGQAATLRAQEMQQAQGAYGQELAAQQQMLADLEAMKAGQYADNQNRQATIDQGNASRNAGIASAIIGGAGTILGKPGKGS